MDSTHERIKELRSRLHLSQDYVAKYLGIEKSAYEQIEKGDCMLSVDDADRLSALFGVTVCNAPDENEANNVSEKLGDFNRRLRDD